jgi:hypothetical protein
MDKRTYWNKYYLLNKAKIRARDNKWAREHSEIIYKSHREYRKRIRLEVITHYGSKCVCCGENKLEFLAIDHIEMNGSQQRLRTFKKKNSAGFQTHAWLRKNNYPSGFQVLCHNCNLARGFYGYCPHQVEGLA